MSPDKAKLIKELWPKRHDSFTRWHLRKIIRTEQAKQAIAFNENEVGREEK